MPATDKPKSLGALFTAPTRTTPTSNEPQCPWCPSPEGDPIASHADWCDRKIMARIIDKGNKNLKKNTVSMLENKVRTLVTQLGEYETTLRLIAAPKRPDGTFNRDRDSCRVLAENILRAYSSKV